MIICCFTLFLRCKLYSRYMGGVLFQSIKNCILTCTPNLEYTLGKIHSALEIILQNAYQTLEHKQYYPAVVSVLCCNQKPMRCDINTPRAAIILIILILRVYFSCDWSRHDKHVKVNSKSLPFSDLPSCSFQ